MGQIAVEMILDLYFYTLMFRGSPRYLRAAHYFMIVSFCESEWTQNILAMQEKEDWINAIGRSIIVR